MIARFFGADTPGSELYSRLGTSGQGTSQGAIVRELRAAGVSANIRYDVGFDRIAREINRGKLLVGYLFDVEHWLVIYGYGRYPDRVFVADPRPQQQCEQPWESYGTRLGDFGIVCSSAARSRPPIEPVISVAAREPAPTVGVQLALPFA
jgi:ABC-type bacteriocin/lantibiotic exporter with double-glycine peptidase domain